MLTAFVFGPGDILALNENSIGLFTKFLNKDLVVELDTMLRDPEFQQYRDIPGFEEHYDFVVNTLSKIIRPIVIIDKLDNTPFPMLNISRSISSVIRNDFSDYIQAPEVFQLCTPNELIEIEGLLEELISLIPDVIDVFPRRSSEDWKNYLRMIEDLSIQAIRLEYLLGEQAPPRNTELARDVKANRSYFYNSNEKPQYTGARWLRDKENDIRIVHNGYKWQRYLLEHKIQPERSNAYYG